MDAFIPKEGTKERRKIQELLKDAASKQKVHWLYVTRLSLTVATFVASLVIFTQLHKMQINIHMQSKMMYNTNKYAKGGNNYAAENRYT